MPCMVLLAQDKKEQKRLFPFQGFGIRTASVVRSGSAQGVGLGYDYTYL